MKIALFAFTLFFAMTGFAKTVSVIYPQKKYTNLELKAAAKKFGYTVGTKKAFDHYQYRYESLKIEVPDDAKNYSEFLSYISDLQISSVYDNNHKKDDSNMRVSFNLKNNISEEEFIKLIDEVRSLGVEVVNAKNDIEAVIPRAQLEGIVAKLDKLNAFRTYNVDYTSTYYFDDRHSTGNVDIKVTVPFEVNPNFVISELSKKTELKVVSSTANEKEETILIISVPNKESLLDLLRSAFGYYSPQKGLLNVRIEIPKKEGQQSSVYPKKPRGSELMIIPFGIYDGLSSHVKETEERLDEVAMQIHKLGYRVIDSSLYPEMGESYLVDVRIQTEGKTLDLEKFSKIGEVFITGGYPSDKTKLNSCTALFY